MRRTGSRVDIFDQDALSHGGYVYTSGGRLSSRLATTRSTDVILELGRFAGRSVLDMGCGDGFYTIQYWDAGRPRLLVGVDAARNAVRVANDSKGTRPIRFAVGDIHRLPYADDSFDVALLQSILHHDDDPEDIIREAFRIAPEILLHEPNGYNAGLKLIEKVSRYHREHGEQSYSPRRLRGWIRKHGGRVCRQKFAGFVPMFCPDPMARAMKAVEPAVEAIGLVSSMLCAVYVVVAARPARPAR